MLRARALLLALIAAPLTGCIGSDGSDGLDQAALDAELAAWGVEIPDVLSGVEHVAQALTPEGEPFVGAGLWVHGNYAYVPGYTTGGLRVIDVSTPSAPVVVGELVDDALGTPRDTDLLIYEDRLVVALATNYAGIVLVEVTDPTAPTIVGKFSWSRVHNLAVVPGTHLIYVSTGRTHIQPAIVDASVPESPEFVGTFSQRGCHDVTFWSSGNGTKERAYCAGPDRTLIFDIADPRVPVQVSIISNPCMDHDLPGSPPWEPHLEDGICGGFHHSAYVNEDASVLIIGDEFKGATAPGCFGHAETPAGTASSPVGALWFYDITNERNPVRLGWFSPPMPVEDTVEALDVTNPPGPYTQEPEDNLNTPYSMLGRASCTSHFGEIVPGHEAIVVGWYVAGVLLVDFSDPANPVLVAQFQDGEMDTWDAKVHNGYIFTGDQARGLDVLTFV